MLQEKKKQHLSITEEQKLGYEYTSNMVVILCV